MPSATYGFTGKPESLQIVSDGGGYTIPAGKYAHVSAESDHWTAHTVNSSVVLAARLVNQKTQGNLTQRTVFDAQGSAYKMKAFLNSAGSAISLTRRTALESAWTEVLGTQATTGTSTIAEFTLYQGEHLTIPATANTGEHVVLHGYPIAHPGVNAFNYWAPAGTVLGGGRYIAQIFSA